LKSSAPHQKRALSRSDSTVILQYGKNKKDSKDYLGRESKMSAVNHLGFSTSHLDEEKPSDDEDSVKEELLNSDGDKKPAATEENQETNGLESAARNRIMDLTTATMSSRQQAQLIMNPRRPKNMIQS
jgi:hypothetical protein